MPKKGYRKKDEKFEPCNDPGGPDCFGYRGGVCGPLAQTYPIGKRCPFRKSREQVEKENEPRKIRGK